MTPSPVLNSSPAPSYVSGYGGSFDDVLEKSFGDFSSHFSTFDSLSCGVQQTTNIYDGDNSHNSIINAETASFYNSSYGPMDLDLELFMNSVPQYTVWFLGRRMEIRISLTPFLPLIA